LPFTAAFADITFSSLGFVLCRRDHTGARPVVFSNLRDGAGIDEIAGVIEAKGGLGVR
jgi:hypothetical protein